MTDGPYEKWLAERRKATPPPTLADQIMRQVVEFDRESRDLWWLRAVQRVDRSRAARWSVCGGALAIGILPFIFFAYVAQLVAF